MKKNLVILAMSVVSFISIPAYANDTVDSQEIVVEVDEMNSDAKFDRAVFCSVAMVNRRGRILRVYQGRRNLRSWRCQGPMNQCRQDIRWRRAGRNLRCVERR